MPAATRSIGSLAAPDLLAPAATALLAASVAAALVALPPLLGAILLAGAVGAVLIIVRPFWGFCLLLLSIPVQDLGAAGELTLTNLLFGLTVVAWLARRAAAPPPSRPGTAGIVGPLFALFVAALALSLVPARELAPGIAALFQWVKALVVYFLALDLLRTRRQVLAALAALAVAGSVEATLGLFQYLTGAGPASFAIGGRFARAYGTFGRPNSYAGYLEMIFPLALLLAGWHWRRRAGPWLATGAAALIGAAVLASFSRGAWLGTLGAVATMLLLAGPRSRVVALAGGLVVALFVLAGGIGLLPASVGDRLGSIVGGADTPDVRTAFITGENFAILERRAHWEAGLNQFAANRSLGVGLGNFNVRYEEFNVSPTFIRSQGHAHNYYIHVAAESGLVGLGAYLLLLGAVVLTGSHALRTAAGRDPFAHGVVVAGLGVVAAVAIHNGFENLHVLSLGIQLSTVWALITVAGRGFPLDGAGSGVRAGAAP